MATKNIELVTRRVEKGLYEVLNAKSGGKHVYLRCSDNRAEVKRDYGWRVCEGRTDETAKPVSELFDRRSKAADVVIEKVRKGEYTEVVLETESKPVKNPAERVSDNPVMAETLSKEVLLARHNTIAGKLGYTPIKTWARGKKALVDRISDMEKNGKKNPGNPGRRKTAKAA